LNLWIVGDAGGFQVLRFTDWYSQTQHGKAIVADPGRKAVRGAGPFQYAISAGWRGSRMS
jgi:hypothetical protein